MRWGFTAGCAGKTGSLRVAYRLFFDVDAQHRGLLQVRNKDAIATTIFAPDRQEWRTDVVRPDRSHTFLAYLPEGVRHILFGFDHLLFLVSLLLPAVLRNGAGGWRPIDHPADAVRDVIKVVTAFTLAHSITLGLATFGWISLSPRVVLPVIATSIISQRSTISIRW
jgi:hypothetical protein